MRTILVGVLLLLGPPVLGQEHVDDLASPRTYDGPPLSLPAVLREAQANNPELLAFRRQLESTRFRSAGQRFLNPPMLESQIWQWALHTLNPAHANMYMFIA